MIELDGDVDPGATWTDDFGQDVFDLGADAVFHRDRALVQRGGHHGFLIVSGAGCKQLPGLIDNRNPVGRQPIDG